MKEISSEVNEAIEILNSDIPPDQKLETLHEMGFSIEEILDMAMGL